MYKILLTIFLIFCSQSLISQYSEEEEAYIDSLESIIENSKNDTSIATAYINLSEILYIVNQDTLHSMGLIAIEIAEKNLAKDNLTPVEKRIFQLVKGNAYNNIGYLYDVKGDLQKALEYYYKSLSIREKLDEKIGISTTLNNIGMAYDMQGEGDKALEFYRKSLAMQKLVGDTLGLAYTYMNMAVIYSDRNEFDTSIVYYNKCIAMHQFTGDNRGEAVAYVGLGTVYKFKNQFQKSSDSYLKAMSMFKEQTSEQGEVECLYGLGELYLFQKNYTRALEYGQESYIKAKKLGHIFLIRNSAKLLMDIYRATNKNKLALEMYDVYIEMKDSLRSSTNDKIIVEQQIKYQFEKKQLADSLQNQKQQEIKDILIAKTQAESDKKDIALSQEKTQKYALYGGLSLVLIFTFFIYNRFKTTNRQKTVIQEQKEVVEEKNREITDSITYAKRIQAAILPPKKIVKEYLNDSFILYKPKDIVAGDFYWMETVSNVTASVPIAIGTKQSYTNDKIASGSSSHRNDGSAELGRNVVLFAAADCSGHGVPGAMMSVVCNNALNRSVREYGLTDPGMILDKTREIVIQEFSKSEENVIDGMDISLCALDGHKMHWSGANNPLWIVRNGEILETLPDKQPIGKYPFPEPFTTHKIEMEKGDCVYIFSDGYQDQFGGDKGKKFKVKNLKLLLLSISHKPMQEQQKVMDETFENWRGNLEQIDDVCLIGVRICDALS